MVLTKEQSFEARIKELEKTQDIPIEDPHEYLASMREIFELMRDILEAKMAKIEADNDE